MRKAKTGIRTHKNYINIFSGIQRVEEFEKDHAGPQQDKHNPTICLQGGQFFMMDVMNICQIEIASMFEHSNCRRHIVNIVAGHQ